MNKLSILGFALAMGASVEINQNDWKEKILKELSKEEEKESKKTFTVGLELRLLESI